MYPITSSLEVIIASEIAEKAMAEEEATVEEEVIVEEEAIAEAVPEALKTHVIRRSAYASAYTHLTLGSLCTVCRGRAFA